MFTRIEIKLTPSVGVMGYDYQEGLQKLAYKALNAVDEAKARRIHNIGLKVNDKYSYRPFLPVLLFEKAEFKDKIYFTECKLSISGITDVVEDIVKGLTKIPIVVNEVSFKAEEVITKKKIRFKKVMEYDVITSVVVSSVDEDNEKEYINFFDDRYFATLAMNLKRKYLAIYNKEYEGELYFDIENILNSKRKSVKVKDNAYVRGNKYKILIEAEKDMQKIAFYLGLGQNNTYGCGFAFARQVDL